MDRVKSIVGRRSSGNIASDFDWMHFWRMTVAAPLLLCAGWSAFGQSVQPGHLPTRKQTGPMTPAEEKNLAFVLRWWREVVESRHTELAVKYAAEDFIQHNPNIPTGRAALLKVFQGLGPAIDPIPDHLVHPPVVEGAKGDFVWMVFEHQGKDPKDPTQPIFAYSFDLLRLQNGKIQEHWDSARKEPGSAPFVPSKAPAPSTWITAKPTTAESQNLAIATRFEKDVVEYGHIEYMDELLSSSFTEHNPGVPADRAGLKEFIHNLPDHQPQEIKPVWKHAPVLAFANGPFVVMMWEKRDKDPSDSNLEYTRNYFTILRIEDGLVQEIWN
jgi:predicted SnoaL-like aldol condensation-catalyzing enzyme